MPLFVARLSFIVHVCVGCMCVLRSCSRLDWLRLYVCLCVCVCVRLCMLQGCVSCYTCAGCMFVFLSCLCFVFALICLLRRGLCMLLLSFSTRSRFKLHVCVAFVFYVCLFVFVC